MEQDVPLPGLATSLVEAESFGSQKVNDVLLANMKAASIRVEYNDCVSALKTSVRIKQDLIEYPYHEQLIAWIDKLYDKMEFITAFLDHTGKPLVSDNRKFSDENKADA